MGWDRQRKREKKIKTRIPFILDPGKKIPKKIEKKHQKIKKPISVIIFGQNGIRLAVKEREKFYSRIMFLPNPS